MAYESNKQKIHNYFFNLIYPSIDKYGVDYYKTIMTISSELKVSIKFVEEFFEQLFKIGKLNESRIIEISEEEIKKREEEKRKIEEEAKNIIENKIIPQETEVI